MDYTTDNKHILPQKSLTSLTTSNIIGGSVDISQVTQHISAIPGNVYGATTRYLNLPGDTLSPLN